MYIRQLLFADPRSFRVSLSWNHVDDYSNNFFQQGDVDIEMGMSNKLNTFRFLQRRGMCPNRHPANWELTEVLWTSTQVRNQNTTKVMITFRFGEPPNFNITPADHGVTLDNSTNRPTRKRTISSPPLTEYQFKVKRQKCQAKSVQTDCTNVHLQRLSCK